MNWLRDWILPEQASTVAPDIDNLFMFITFVDIFFFVLIAALVILFAKRYRRRGPNEITHV